MAERSPRSSGSPRDDRPAPPLKTYRRMLTDEIALADAELSRPAGPMATSALLAGLGVCVSVFLIAVMQTHADPAFPELARRFFIGNAYAAGFLVVIFARADLFTEYTTITLLPVFLGRSSVRALARLWGIVYAANLVGATAGAAFLALLRMEHAAFTADSLGVVASELAQVPAGGMLVGAVLAGWLMGLMSWLVVAARETVSQLVFVWVIGTVIGFGLLPHSITGSAEVAAAAFAGAGIDLTSLLRFLGISTLGNALGSGLFALLIRYAVAGAPDEPAD